MENNFKIEKKKKKLCINNYLNVNSLNVTIESQESGRLDKKSRAYNVLPTRDPL